MQCFVYSPLHVCLRVKHFVYNYYSRLAHVLNDERFCIRIHCTLYYTYWATALRIIFIIIVTVAVPHVCVCVCSFSFLPPCASTPRNIGAYAFTATLKTLYIAIRIVIFAENASFRSYGRRNLLASNAINCS